MWINVLSDEDWSERRHAAAISRLSWTDSDSGGKTLRFMWSGRRKVAVKKCTGYLLFCLSAGWRWIKMQEHVEAVLLPFHLLSKWVWGLESAVYPLHSAWQRNHLKLAAEETAVCHQRQRSNQLFTCCCPLRLLPSHQHTQPQAASCVQMCLSHKQPCFLSKSQYAPIFVVLGQ